MKKILYVFPYDLYPVMGGGSQRAIAIMNFLASNGFDLVLITTKSGEELSGLLNSRITIKAISTEAKKDSRKLHFEKVPKGVYRRNLNFLLVTSVLNELENEVYDVLFTNFLWTIPCIENAPEGVLCILDIHDVQHLRARQFRKNNIGNGDYECSKRFEISKYRKCDYIVCINQNELKYLSKYIDKSKLLYVPFFLSKRKQLVARQQSKTILFIGNAYPPNEIGIRNFIKNSFRIIQKHTPGVKLLIAGKICDKLSDLQNVDGVALIGWVPDLEKLYFKVDLVVVPVDRGTGMKVKAVEALMYGKTVLIHKHSATGIDYFSEFPDQVVENFDQFTLKSICILMNLGVQKRIEERTWNYVSKNLIPEKICAPLVTLIGSH